MNGELKISESVWDVMENAWEGGPSTAADVIKALRSTHEWNHSMIRTLLARLVEKGVLAYDVVTATFCWRVFAIMLRLNRPFSTTVRKTPR